MFLTGRRITGEEAFAWGLADLLVEPDRFARCGGDGAGSGDRGERAPWR